MKRGRCLGRRGLQHHFRRLPSNDGSQRILSWSIASRSLSSIYATSDSSWNAQTRIFLEKSSSASASSSPKDVLVAQAQELMDFLVSKPGEFDDEGQPRAVEDPQHDATLAFDFLDRLFEMERSTTSYHNELTTNCLDSVILLWRQTCGSENSIPTSEVLAKLDEYRAHSNFLIPDVKTYNILLDGAASRKEIDLCLELWDWMWQESNSDNLVKPDVVTLRTLLKAWVLSGYPDAPERCEALVEEWIKNKGDSRGIRKSFIHIWALSDPTQAEAYLKDMARRHKENPEEEDPPDTIAWNRVISAFAIQYKQPHRAARLLEDFWDFSSQLASNSNIRPDLFSYNSVLEGWARVGDATEANKTLARLQKAKSISPNIISYTSAMKANGADIETVDKLAQECIQAYQEQEGGPSHHQHLVLDQGFFHIWLNACLKAGGQTNRACEIVDQMESSSLIPDATCYSCLLDCFLANDDDLEGATRWLLDNAEDMVESSIVSWVLKLVSRGDISIVSFFNKFFGKNQPTPLLQILYENDYLKEPESYERLLAQLPAEQGHTLLSKWTKNPTNKGYSIVLRAFAKEANGMGAEALFNKWQVMNKTEKGGPIFIEDMYTSLVVAWSKTGNVERTKFWFDEYANRPDLRPPNSTAQTAVLSAYSQAFHPKEAEAFLNELAVLYQSGRLDTPPDLVMHNVVLDAWARAASGKRAKKFLEKMEQKDIVSYNTVIKAFVKQRNLDSAKEFSLQVVQLYRKDPEAACRPDLATFRLILSGWVRARDLDKAEKILHWMRELYNEGVLGEPPDANCYQIVLDGWTKSKINHAGQRAEKTFREMVAADGGTNAAPLVTASAYSKVMKCYKRNPEKVEALLHEMYGSYLQGKKELKPTAESFWIVLESLTRRRPPESSDSWLRQMRKLHQSGGLETAKPTKQAYNLVLRSWAHSKHQDAGDRAESLLRVMQSQYLEEGDSGVQPTMESYKWVLTAMSRKKDANHVEALFQELCGAYFATNKQKLDLKPDAACFNSVLVACRSTGDAERAQSFLSQIENWNDMEILDTRPTVKTYNLVLACFASTGFALKAETLLQHMEERGICPDIVSYNSVIRACLNSPKIDTLSRVESLIRRMLVSPDAMTFSMLLKTIASSTISNKGDRAAEVFKMMKLRGFEPTSQDLKHLELSTGQKCN